MKRIIAITILSITFLLSSTVLAGTTGLQAIGFSNWTANDVKALADDFAQAGGNLELSFLPNEFNPNKPYDNATSFAQNLLPRLNGQLRLTVYLWFHSNRFEWTAFTPGNERATFRQNYLRRVAEFDQWAKSLQNWAEQRDLSGKLSITLCPYLEDDCRNATTYMHLLNAIRAQQRADGISIPMRRSADKSNRFRVENLPLELHGRYSSLGRSLRSGDVFSNDGNFVWLDAATIPGSKETSKSFTPSYGSPTSCRDFIRNQRKALAKGASVLFWRPSYNGLKSGGNNPSPSDRRNLTPLTGSNGKLERAALLKVIRSR